jgi:hypothetical protein
VIYAGIGSRKTPKPILDVMVEIGMYMAQKGHILRSGRAQGADQAFEDGCNRMNGRKEIYLPWWKFENAPMSKGYIIADVPEAYVIARAFHPNWDALSDGAKKLIIRNSHQVLGLDCKTPCDFVVCWTEGGRGEGGTGQALRIAKSRNIEIFDLGIKRKLVELEARLL